MGAVKRGLSLTETMISIFILLVCLLVVVLLYHSGLRHSGQSQREVLSRMLAENRLEQLRALPYAQWAALVSGSSQDPRFPEYTVRVEVSSPRLQDPCSRMEATRPVDQQRSLAVKTVHISVTGPGLAGRSLTSLLSEPVRSFRALDAIVVSQSGGDPAPLGHDRSAEFTAVAYDQAGAVIPDLVFFWSLRAGSGNGTLTQNRSGTLASFKNGIYLPGRAPIYTGNSVVVVARARFHGVEREGLSAPLALL